MAAARNINQPWFFVLGCFNQCNGVRLKTQLATFFSTRKPSQVILYSLWNPCLIFTFHWYSLIDTHWILLDVTVTFEDICSKLDTDVDLVIVVDVEVTRFKLKFVSFGWISKSRQRLASRPESVLPFLAMFLKSISPKRCKKYLFGLTTGGSHIFPDYCMLAIWRADTLVLTWSRLTRYAAIKHIETLWHNWRQHRDHMNEQRGPSVFDLSGFYQL